MLLYLAKFSISIAVLYIFYRVVLRPLTCYTWNRFYLLCYSLCSFVIPFIDISPWVAKESAQQSPVIKMIPVIGNYPVTANQPVQLSFQFAQLLTGSQWMLMLFCTGALVMLVRFLLQYRSLRRIRRQSVLLNSEDDVQLFQTDAPVNPFSFGNAIYFNNSLHSSEELQRIIQHEFVHVKQQHSIDIVISELLCIVNWFNPFAWLIRYAIRQNLEFIADSIVIQNGIDKKEYQYLLLKVVGISQYGIGNHFNFSNLKKRIVMMNKIKTARLHLAKFLFVLPLLAVLLLAFRNNQSAGKKTATDKTEPALIQMKHDTMPSERPAPVVYKDTLVAPPPPPLAPPVPDRMTGLNQKGYIISLADDNGERIVLVKDRARKIVKAVSFAEWNKNKKENEQLYGRTPAIVTRDISPVPPPPAKEELRVVPAAPPNNQMRADHPAALLRRENTVGSIPADVLIYLDDKALPAGIKLDDVIKPGDIKVINVYKDKDVIALFGEKGKHGVIDIKTKAYWQQNYTNVKFDADSIVRSHFDQFIVNGTINTNGNESIIDGSFSFENKIERPLVVFDGRQLPELIKIAPPAGRYRMLMLDSNEAFKKYGNTAKYGAIELTTLSKAIQKL